MIYSQFKKKILNKGRFEQFAISPYNTGELGMGGIYTRILIISDQVDSVELLKNSSRAKDSCGVIIPFNTDICTSIQNHLDEIKKQIVVGATYFTIYDLFTHKSMYRISSSVARAIHQKET